MNDKTVNYIILGVRVENLNFILINIYYGPNNDSLKFYKEFSNKIRDISQHIILGVYFN